MRALVKLVSKPIHKNDTQLKMVTRQQCIPDYQYLPFQASAKVILFPLPVPFPMKVYLPSQLFKRCCLELNSSLLYLLGVAAISAGLGVAPIVIAASAMRA